MSQVEMNANIASITWEIENFSKLRSKVISPSFSFPNNQNITSKLALFPKVQMNHFVQDEAVDLMVVLPYVQGCSSGMVLFCYVSIMNSKGKKCSTQARLVNVRNTSYINPYEGGFYYYLGGVKEDGLLNDKLTIYCEIKIMDLTDRQECFDSIAQDYGSLLESGQFSDVVLLVGGKELKAHRNVLAARSKVFAAMFEQNSKGQLNNRVEITDVDKEVFDELLRYIYTGKVVSLDQCTVQLLAEANKYKLDLLKTICEKHLIDTLTVNSVAQILLLSDLHQTTQLKAKCIDYITEHAKDIKLADWKVICERNLDMALQLFQYKR